MSSAQQTSCPHCHATFSVNEEQLRSADGKVRCGACLRVFDALSGDTGFVPTDINRKMIEGTDRGRRILEHTPMARFGSSDEIAGAAVYLASKAGSFVNGICIPVDGGYLASGIGDSVAPWEAEKN